MIQKFKALNNTMKFYVMSIIGLIFQSIESIVDLANVHPAVSLILSAGALVSFGMALFFALRKDGKQWSS